MLTLLNCGSSLYREETLLCFQCPHVIPILVVEVIHSGDRSPFVGVWISPCPCFSYPQGVGKGFSVCSEAPTSGTVNGGNRLLLRSIRVKTPRIQGSYSIPIGKSWVRSVGTSVEGERLYRS